MIDREELIYIGKEFMLTHLSNDHVTNADRDVTNLLTMQKKRLKENDLSLNKIYTDRGHVSQGRIIGTMASNNYTHYMCYYTTNVDNIVNRNGKAIYKRSDNENFYTYITDSNNYEVSKDDTYCCPNCGGVSTLQQISSECPYCKTKFRMSQLYPKVSSYYGLWDPSGKEEEIKSDIFKSVKKVWMIESIFYVIGAISLIIEKHYFDLILLFAIMAGVGFIIGYLIWAIKIMSRLFMEAGKSIPLLTTLPSLDKFSKKMKSIDENFDKEHFVFKMVSYCKMIIFSDDDTTLPFYCGNRNNVLDDVIDSRFRGATKIDDVKVEGNKCTVKLKLYFNNLHYNGKKVCEKNDKISLTIFKDLSNPSDYNFSINKFACKGCGRSYNGYLQKVCPYCGKEISVASYDWVISEIK